MFWPFLTGSDKCRSMWDLVLAIGIVQITLSSVQFCLSLTEADCFHAVWNEILQSFKVFYSFKKYLHFTQNSCVFMSFEVMMWFYYWCFITCLEQTSVVHWTWIPVFVIVMHVTVWSVLIYHQHHDSMESTLEKFILNIYRKLNDLSNKRFLTLCDWTFKSNINYLSTYVAWKAVVCVQGNVNFQSLLWWQSSVTYWTLVAWRSCCIWWLFFSFFLLPLLFLSCWKWLHTQQFLPAVVPKAQLHNNHAVLAICYE